jgi:type IV secretory pathway VirB2 component (pilin)
VITVGLDSKEGKDMTHRLRRLVITALATSFPLAAEARPPWGSAGNAPGQQFLEGLVGYGLVIAPLVIVIGLILGGILWAAGSENGPRRCMYAVLGGGVALLASGFGAFLTSIAH